VLTGAADGTARIWDIKSGAEVARLIPLDLGSNWVTVTPDGYFIGSPGGKKMAGWRIDGDLFPLACYEKHFQRP
jgi:hypothetical protein